MGVIEGRTWLEVLPVAECWRFVKGEDIGRVAVLVDGAPEIFPINHVVDQESIVFRSDPGSKLRSLLRSPLVCFEADAIDAAARRGWSVMIKGRASELTAGDEIARASRLPLHPWAFGEKSHWIRISPVEVTGRRLYRPGSSE